MRALASAAVIADSIDYNLIIIWKKDEHCDAAFDELFEGPNLFYTLHIDPLDCHPDYLYPAKECTDGYSSPCPPKHDKERNKKRNSKRHSDSLEQFSCLQEAEPEWMRRITARKDVYIETACVISHPKTNWRKESTWLQTRIQPVPIIQNQINIYANKFVVHNCIGVHIRMGQQASQHSYENCNTWKKETRLALENNRRQSNYIYFMLEIEKIWRDNPKQVFFICADNDYIYTEFAKKYPGDHRIVYVPKDVYDRSLQQLYSAMIDVYLLSKTKYVLGSPWSSFTELVLRLGVPEYYYPVLISLHKSTVYYFTPILTILAMTSRVWPLGNIYQLSII